MSTFSQKPSFVFKRGDSFEFTINLKDSSGSPLEVLPGNIKSDLKDSTGSLVETLLIEAGATTGEYIVSGTTTSNYPIGILVMDFKINNDGKIISSPTLYIEVQKEITQW